ncbi:MAG: hypothetical protein MJE77_46375, partial [Proteobacteria bacterium]|nr:hypothetical protein [Pseudomonadota bacterium]
GHRPRLSHRPAGQKWMRHLFSHQPLATALMRRSWCGTCSHVNLGGSSTFYRSNRRGGAHLISDN